MAQGVHHSETWYEATAARGPARAPLAGVAACDACVIGGGLAGITLAHELAKAGTSVKLLEARRLAWGASGRNGGFVSAGFAEGMDAVAARAGLDAARQLFKLSEHGAEHVRAHGGGAMMGDGMIITSRSAQGFGNHAAAMNRDHGTALEDWPRGKTRARLDSARYVSAIHNPRAFHIHPLRYALALACKAEAAGAILHENTKAVAITRQASGFEVATTAGAVRCADVIVCVSALDRALHRSTARAILPVATYIAVTEPLQQTAIRTNAAIADTRRAGDYYRLIDEGRLLWGGRITTRVAEPSRLAERMRGDMLSVFPQLGTPRIDYAWAGIMGYALHKMPLIGRGADGVWFATAFGGHGLNTTAMAGLLIARAIAAGDDEYRRFAPFGLQWAGGPFGRAGVQASYWAMQARDRFDEWRAA